jgi:hypothetical protein
VKVADASVLAGLFSQPNARSGVSVTIDSALKVSTVFACLRVLADGIAHGFVLKPRCSAIGRPAAVFGTPGTAAGPRAEDFRHERALG